MGARGRRGGDRQTAGLILATRDSQIRSRCESSGPAARGRAQQSSVAGPLTLRRGRSRDRAMGRRGFSREGAARRTPCAPMTCLAVTAGNPAVPTSLFGKITTTTNWISIHSSERLVMRRGNCFEEDMSPGPGRRPQSSTPMSSLLKTCTSGTQPLILSREPRRGDLAGSHSACGVAGRLIFSCWRSRWRG